MLCIVLRHDCQLRVTDTEALETDRTTAATLRTGDQPAEPVLVSIDAQM